MDESIIRTIINNRRVMLGHLEPPPASDQSAGLPQPPLHKQLSYLKVIDLPADYRACIKNNDLFHVMNSRTSHRSYTAEPLRLEELSWLLWATQGERRVAGRKNLASMRTVPSAGARHAFETYLFIDRVAGLEKGLYHYIADGHRLGFLGGSDTLTGDMVNAFGGQSFIAGSAVFFAWTATPYRMEWRYGAIGQKYTLLDAGHVCQSLYLAAGAVDCGVCAIGHYYQQPADALLGLNPEAGMAEREFVVYAAALGKIALSE